MDTGPASSDLIHTEDENLLSMLLDGIETDRRDDDWMNRARCAEVDGELFFPEKGGSTRSAKLVCRGCEVRAECLQFALDHPEIDQWGIWGGLSEQERRQLKRKAS